MSTNRNNFTVSYQVEPMKRPTVSRFQQTTNHRPRNTKGNLRRQAAAVRTTLGE